MITVQSLRARVGAASVVILALAIGGAVLRTSGSATQLKLDPSKWVTQPEEWVPLSYEVDFAQNLVPSATRFSVYRSSNGSTRTVSSAPAGVETVQIDNVSENKHFRWITGRTGTVHPLRPRPNGGKPFAVINRSRTRQVSPSDPRVAHLSSLGNPLTFWEFVGSSGARVVFCAELNLLDVYADLGAGRTKKVVNLVLGEPADSLFVVPSDVALEARAEAEGSGNVAGPPSLQKKQHPQ